MEFIKHKINLESLDLTFYTIGEGKPILFLHGGGADALTFKESIEVLAKYGKVYAPDIPGSGESSSPQEVWNFTDYAKFFNKFIEEQKLTELTVVGNSWGGGIALHLSLDNLNINKLILGNSSGIKIDDSALKFVFNFFIKKSINDISEAGGLRNLNRAKEGVKRTFRNHRKEYIHGLKIIKKCLRQETPDLSSIKAKTLILSSTKDEIFPIKHAQELNKGIKNSQLKTFDGNHSWMLFKTNEFKKAIKNFMSI